MTGSPTPTDHIPPHWEAIAEAIHDKFFLPPSSDAEQGFDPGPAPRLATSGDEPPMTFEHEHKEHHKENGADRNFIHQLRSIVGRVRFGWAVAITSLSPVFLIAAMLVHNGWIETPAKDSDIKAVQIKLTSLDAAQIAQTEAIRSIGIAVARLEEDEKATRRSLDGIDGKIDSIISQQLAIMRAFAAMPMEPQKASTPSSPPPSLSQRSRARAPKKQETGFFFSR
jgi:hypothetical protein